MVTTDGHRLAYVEKKNIRENGANDTLDTLIPRKTLAELTKLTAGFDEEISLGMDENHVYFQVGPRLLIPACFTGSFPITKWSCPRTTISQWSSIAPCSITLFGVCSDG